MRPSAVHSPSLILTPPCFTSGRLCNPRLRLHLHHRHRLPATAIRSSTSTGGEGDGTTNEEGVLTTLGMRGAIKKEMRAMERGEQEWDKELSYTFYESEVCELMGLMHLCLTRTQPRLAIGIMVTLHVPTSVLVVAMRVLDAAKGILEELNI